MYHLATVAPIVRRIRIPLSRDQIMLLMAAINEIFLGIDIYLAHNISGTIVPREWIPIIFGPFAGGLLLFAGLVAIKQRPLATLIATLVLLGSIIVGLLGPTSMSSALPCPTPRRKNSSPCACWSGGRLFWGRSCSR